MIRLPQVTRELAVLIAMTCASSQSLASQLEFRGLLDNPLGIPGLGSHGWWTPTYGSATGLTTAMAIGVTWNGNGGGLPYVTNANGQAFNILAEGDAPESIANFTAVMAGLRFQTRTVRKIEAGLPLPDGSTVPYEWYQVRHYTSNFTNPYSAPSTLKRLNVTSDYIDIYGDIFHVSAEGMNSTGTIVGHHGACNYGHGLSVWNNAGEVMLQVDPRKTGSTDFDASGNIIPGVKNAVIDSVDLNPSCNNNGFGIETVGIDINNAGTIVGTAKRWDALVCAEPATFPFVKKPGEPMIAIQSQDLRNFDFDQDGVPEFDKTFVRPVAIGENQRIYLSARRYLSLFGATTVTDGWPIVINRRRSNADWSVRTLRPEQITAALGVSNTWACNIQGIYRDLPFGTCFDTLQPSFDNGNKKWVFFDRTTLAPREIKLENIVGIPNNTQSGCSGFGQYNACWVLMSIDLHGGSSDNPGLSLTVGQWKHTGPGVSNGYYLHKQMIVELVE
jgi:hypothetical protein